VTAFCLEDGLQILQQTVFKDTVAPTPTNITADVDVSSLDPTHVVPYINPSNWRGLWFPRGFVDWDQ
jgi:hypothetical protein